MLPIEEAWYDNRLCLQLKHTFQDQSEVNMNWTQTSQLEGLTVLSLMGDTRAAGLNEPKRLAKHVEWHP